MASLTQLPSILSLSTPFPGFFWKSNCVLVKILRSSPGLNRNSALKLWNNIQFVLHKVAPLGIGFQEVFISTSCIEIDVTRQTTSLASNLKLSPTITHWIYSSGETKRVSKSPSLGSVTWIRTQTPATACCSLTWVSRAFVEREPSLQPTWLGSQSASAQLFTPNQITDVTSNFAIITNSIYSQDSQSQSLKLCCQWWWCLAPLRCFFIVCSFYSCLSIQLFFFSLINKYDLKCSDFPSHLMISSAICYSPPKTL